MTHVVGDVLRRHGVLGLAIVLMLALAVYDVVRATVFAFLVPILEEVDRDLTFTVRGTTFSYGDALGMLLTLALLAGLLALVWRMRPADTHPCPDCLSDIPTAAAVCRYCTSEVRPST
jgi:large conductance mechanosensitive channel